MKNRLIPIGVVALIIGILILLLIQDPSANNLEIAQHATSAQAAAEAISRNNQSYALWHTIGMFFSGLGIALTVGGIIMRYIRKDK